MENSKKYTTLQESLNDICCYLAEGEKWHNKMANECRKIYIRGWGRWHEAESKGDKEMYTCLEKILMDKISYSPMIDAIILDKAMKEKFTSASDFKTHHSHWIMREEKLINALNYAIHESRSVDIEIYYKLCEILKEVQNEAMRVKMVIGRLDLAGWNGHDIGICSYLLHEYFEKCYHGGEIDFNIG